MLPSGNRMRPSLVSKLLSGIRKLPSGISKLPSGISKLPSGILILPSGSRDLPSGIRRLPSGMTTPTCPAKAFLLAPISSMVGSSFQQGRTHNNDELRGLIIMMLVGVSRGGHHHQSVHQRPVAIIDQLTPGFSCHLGVLKIRGQSKPTFGSD